MNSSQIKIIWLRTFARSIRALTREKKAEKNNRQIGCTTQGPTRMWRRSRSSRHWSWPLPPEGDLRPLGQLNLISGSSMPFLITYFLHYTFTAWHTFWLYCHCPLYCLEEENQLLQTRLWKKASLLTWLFEGQLPLLMYEQGTRRKMPTIRC